MPRDDTAPEAGPHTTSRSLILGLIVLVSFTGSAAFGSDEAGASHANPAAAKTGFEPASGESPGRAPWPREGRPVRRTARDLDSNRSGTAGWWFGSFGVAVVLAACGVVCVAAKKYLPQPSTNLLQVIGRVNLSPRHSVYLLRVEGRVLLIGAGSQGAPSYLGELADTTLDTEDRPDYLPAAEFSPPPSVPVPSSRGRAFRPSPAATGARFDVRVGDEE